MLTASNIYVQYGDRILLDRITTVVKPGERTGLTGRNGAGKSTFLKIIAGEISPDEGDISRAANSTLGFLHQEMDLPKGKTVLDETMTAFGEVRRIEQRLDAINEELAVRTDYESDGYAKILEELGELTDRFQLLGGHNAEAEAQKVLSGLGFKDNDMDRLTDEFSGGWQMRIELAKMLLSQPDFLLLDEPTNHLDIESILWLERFLQTYSGAVIVISHDRTFLDNVTNRTLEIENGNLYDYKAGYSKYVQLREERREQMASAYKNQQRVIADKERTIARFMAKATKTKMAQSMQKRLDKVDRVELDVANDAAMNIRFAPAPRSGEVVVKADELTKSYGEVSVLQSVDLQIERGNRVAFVGQNGQGKTTLSKIIAGIEPATKGDMELGYNVSIGYYAQNQAETLAPDRTLLQTMEDHSPEELRPRLRSILGAFMFSGEDVDKKVSVLSGGERARLAMAVMLLRPFNLLILDEPTNHLDMRSKEVLKNALLDYDGTLIVVSHDRDFLADLTDITLEFRDHKLHEYLGDVNYFLSKRQVDDMRSVEKRTKANGTAAATKPKLDPSEANKLRRQLGKQISTLEKKIEKAEAKIEKLQLKMADPAFYEQPDHQKEIARYQQLQTDLAQHMSDWEAAEGQLEELE